MTDRKAGRVMATEDILAGTPLPEGILGCMVQIGAKGGMRRRYAVEAAQATLKLARQSPEAQFHPYVDGYDDDPREVLDIPEAAAQFRAYSSELTRLQDVTGYPLRDRLTEQARVILLLCAGILPRDAVEIVPHEKG